jgi:hypothetical protein
MNLICIVILYVIEIVVLLNNAYSKSALRPLLPAGALKFAERFNLHSGLATLGDPTSTANPARPARVRSGKRIGAAPARLMQRDQGQRLQRRPVAIRHPGDLPGRMCHDRPLGSH